MDHLHEQVFDAVPDPLVVLDARGCVAAANAAALRVLDLGHEFTPDNRVRLGVDMEALIELSSRGEKIDAVPVTDRSGRISGVTVDVIPLAHEAGGQTLLHFRARTDALARELWTDDAVATVAHEFRNPLASMRSALSVLAAGDAGALAQEQVRFVDAVQRGIARLSRIVDGYLDLGRARAGVLALERKEEHVRTLLESVVRDFTLCQPSATERVQVDVAGDCGRVFVDRDRITQVLLNLVYNAARFTPDGKRVTLRAVCAGREALDDRLRVLPFELFGEPAFTCIEVEDEGLGMSSDVLAHVFERYRDDMAGAVPGGGAHLGLHIARALVDAHDGTMRIESRLGEGTTARVFLPADPQTACTLARLRMAEESVQVARAARRTVTVALVEDDALRMSEELPAKWWRKHSAQATKNHGVSARVWVLRDGLALLMTCGDLPVIESWLAGACRIGLNMTFSGAVRAAAARLAEQKNRGAVRALEPVSE